MRILLVEDARAVQNAMSQLLTAQGHVCDGALTAGDAWHLLQTESYDLVVLDLNLPDRPGYSLLKDMQLAGLACAVFVVSARADLEDRVSLLRAGADDYLVKPFDPEEFTARIEALLRRPKKISAQTARLGGLEVQFHPARATDIATGQDLPLSPRERGVLAQLALQVGETVQKTRLTNALFNLESSVQPAAIEVYVSRLRAKLKQAGARLEIQTVRGLGYRLIEQRPEGVAKALEEGAACSAP